MKKASRHYRIPSQREIIKHKLLRLKELVRDEIEFGVPSYEDGSLSPKYGFKEIFNQLDELDALFNQRIDNVNLCQQNIQPPATPEALE